MATKKKTDKTGPSERASKVEKPGVAGSRPSSTTTSRTDAPDGASERAEAARQDARTDRASHDPNRATSAKDGMVKTDLNKPPRQHEVHEFRGDEDANDRGTTREGLKPIGREKPHPTAAARVGKTSGEAGRQMDAAPLEPGEVDERDGRTTAKIQVEAIQMGYYNHTRRRTGDVFDIFHEEDFSALWMRRTDGRRPPKVTTGNQALRQQHDEILGARRSNQVNVERDDVRSGIRDTGDNPLGAD